MDSEMKDFSATPTPTLTFEPFKEEPTTQAVPQTKEEVSAPALDESSLTAEERKMVDDFAAQIDLENSNLVLQYGAGAQKKIADFSETALGSVRTKDLGEIGEMLTGVVTELRSFDQDEDDKGFMGLFKKNANKINTMKAKYAKAETNVTRICQILEGHQIQLLKDVAMLDKMYELNKTYFKELSMYILAGKKKLQKVRDVELPALIDKSL